MPDTQNISQKTMSKNPEIPANADQLSGQPATSQHAASSGETIILFNIRQAKQNHKIFGRGSGLAINFHWAVRHSYVRIVN